jgi:hypothetical protein
MTFTASGAAFMWLLYIFLLRYCSVIPLYAFYVVSSSGGRARF